MLISSCMRGCNVDSEEISRRTQTKTFLDVRIRRTPLRPWPFLILQLLSLRPGVTVRSHSLPCHSPDMRHIPSLPRRRVGGQAFWLQHVKNRDPEGFATLETSRENSDPSREREKTPAIG